LVIKTSDFFYPKKGRKTMNGLRSKIWLRAFALCTALLLIVVGVALACDTHHSEQADCRGYRLAGSYTGDGFSNRKIEWNVAITIDGAANNQSGSVETKNSVSLYDLSDSTRASVSAHGWIKLYEPKKHGGWNLVSTDNVNFNFNDTSCGQTWVTFCHATPPDTAKNGWNELTVADDAIFKQGHDGHGADIIPGFAIPGDGSYPGKNLGTIFHDEAGNPWSGQQILDNHCVFPRANTAVLLYENDCVDYNVSATASTGATITGNISGVWSDPHVLEGPIPAGVVHVAWTEGLPLSMDIPYAAFMEPAECNPTNSASLTVDKNCDGWTIDVFASPGAYPMQLPSDSWKDPYHTETEPAGIVVVSWPIGSPASITLNYAEIIEPEECLVTIDHNYVATPVVDCEGWGWSISVVLGQWTSNDLLSGLWTEPYIREKSDTPTITIVWDDAFTQDVVLDEITEPEICLITLVHNFEILTDKDCGGWWVTDVLSSDGGIETALTPTSGTWNDPYTRETATVEFTVTWPDGFTDNRSTIIAEGEECLIVLEHTATVNTDADCDGWTSEIVDISDDGFVTGSSSTSGAWVKPHELESANVSYTVAWPDGVSDTFEATVNEPTGCNPDNWAQISLTNNCANYALVVTHSEGGTHEDPPAGLWTDPFKIEEIEAGMITVSFNTGLPETVDLSWEKIVEPQNCLVPECPWIPGIAATDPLCKPGTCPVCGPGRLDEAAACADKKIVQVIKGEADCTPAAPCAFYDPVYYTQSIELPGFYALWFDNATKEWVRIDSVSQGVGANGQEVWYIAHVKVSKVNTLFYYSKDGQLVSSRDVCRNVSCDVTFTCANLLASGVLKKADILTGSNSWELWWFMWKTLKMDPLLAGQVIDSFWNITGEYQVPAEYLKNCTQ
jgi:hypothetical protein